MTDRELEVIWEKNEGCQAEWRDLFQIKRTENEFKPLVIPGDLCMNDG